MILSARTSDRKIHSSFVIAFYEYFFIGYDRIYTLTGYLYLGMKLYIGLIPGLLIRDKCETLKHGDYG